MIYGLLKKMLSDFFAQKAMDEADKLWEERQYTQITRGYGNRQQFQKDSHTFCMKKYIYFFYDRKNFIVNILNYVGRLPA